MDVTASKLPLHIIGAGPFEWVWAAISAGDINVVRAAPACFDVGSAHSTYGSVLTAFLSGLLNMQGRFFMCADRRRLAQDLVAELGRRGARPDVVINSANFKVQSLYQDWHLVGDITALQVVIQIRDSLLEYSVQADTSPDSQEGAKGDADTLNLLIDMYAELAAQGGLFAARTLVPDAVVDIWERCLKDKANADITIVCADGQMRASSFLLQQASPVLAAMLASGMREGQEREICVQHSLRVVELFLALLHTGCLPQDAPAEAIELQPGVQVIVGISFMSNSARNILLPAGLEGEVSNVDKKGDALIKFDGIPVRQWVWRRNFVRLQTRIAEARTQLRQDLAGALVLAHLWQVQGLGEVLTERLQRNLGAEEFETVLETAELHDIASLRTACMAFAQHSGQVRAAFEAKSYSDVVLESLRPLFVGSGLKRPREAV